MVPNQQGMRLVVLIPIPYGSLDGPTGGDATHAPNACRTHVAHSRAIHDEGTVAQQQASDILTMFARQVIHKPSQVDLLVDVEGVRWVPVCVPVDDCVLVNAYVAHFSALCLLVAGVEPRWLASKRAI